MLIFGVMLGGALGALARYTASILAVHLVPGSPVSASTVGTLTVNVVGSFLLGLLVSLGAARNLPPSVTVPVATGFIGSLTTFSTFSLESHALLQDGRLAWSVGYLVVSLSLGLLAVHLGRAVGSS
ncbi:MAG TPA: fluoride efflux transporter CrcB [Trueperaceae bacterium]